MPDAKDVTPSGDSRGGPQFGLLPPFMLTSVPSFLAVTTVPVSS